MTRGAVSRDRPWGLDVSVLDGADWGSVWLGMGLEAEAEEAALGWPQAVTHTARGNAQITGLRKIRIYLPTLFSV